MMEVHVYSISVPAMSTIGYGYGLKIGTGDEVYFSGDRQSMRELSDALQLGKEPPVALIEPWQVICQILSEERDDRKGGTR